MNNMLQGVFEDVLVGNKDEVENGVILALETCIPADEILNKSLIAAMTEVGKRFENGDLYIPEMLISARAMQAGLAILKPHLLAGEVTVTGKVIIGTVKSDLHDIGKILVAMMLEGVGFQVIDLGTNVAPEKFVEGIQTYNPDIVAMSALLTTTMQNMKATIDAIEKANLRDRVKIIIGGAPVTDDFAMQISADGFAPDASRATSLAKSLVV